ncbi:MAG: hypothetical protein PHV07_09155, partial [Oscillospiraceae bacterium]|nr:hypothetical protein [Oscillospiraceae bacterium]
INRINSWLETYGDVTSLSFGQKEDLWNNVKRSRTEYLRIEDKLAKYKQISENGENLKNELFELTKNYFNELDENPSKNVNLLKEKRKEYSRLFKELADLKARKEQFKNENDIEILKNMAVPEHNLGELQSHEKALENDLDGITVEENNAREQIRNLSEDADRCSELGSEIDQLYEELKIGEERLEILNKTVQCLGNAKENFSTRYMDKMYQGFEHYIKMLDNGTLGETHIDLELNVNVSAYGSQKSLDYFSTGYKDLVGIATRFALIDALFENEKPFIILDDPFTNLDGEKLNKALSMIQEISRKYQIIYFVCHESRVTCN